MQCAHPFDADSKYAHATTTTTTTSCITRRHFKTQEAAEEEEYNRSRDIPLKRSAQGSVGASSKQPAKRQRATDQSLDMSFKLVPEDPDALVAGLETW